MSEGGGGLWKGRRYRHLKGQGFHEPLPLAADQHRTRRDAVDFRRPNNALSTCRLFVPNLILSSSVFERPLTAEVVTAIIHSIHKNFESNNDSPRGNKTHGRDAGRITNQGRSISKEDSDAI